MSIELLDPPPDNSTPITNTKQHDLESLFYVFVWICSLYAAPGIVRDLDKNSASNSVIILKWNEVKDSREIGEIKRSHLSYGGNKLAACFTPYFASLRGCCIQLLDAIFPKTSEACIDCRASLSPVTHEQIITIFKTALEQVLEEERADVNTTDSHATNVPVQLPSIMVQKRHFGDIADSEPHTDQHIPIVNTAPIHNVTNFKDLGIRPVPDCANPRRKRARYD